MKSLIVACALGVAVAAHQAAPSQTFRAATHAVAVDVAVILDDYVVNWLKPGDFEVFDDGVPQTIVSVDRQRLPIDIRLMIDTSGSIAPDAFERYRQAMTRVANSLQPTDRCEVVAFARRITAIAPPQSPPLTIDLRRGPADGTSFFDAVSMALVAAPATERRRMIIALSDAKDNASFLDEAAMLDLARRSDAVVYTVLPLASSSDMAPFVARLQSLSLLTGGRLVPAYRDSQIGDILAGAIKEFRNSYVVRYTLHAPIRTGWHALTVKVHGEYKYVVRARPGYFID